MRKKFNIENWNRKEHYLFFKNFDEPFWGTVVNIEVTNLYEYIKESNFSFFSYSLHKILTVVNSIPEFRLRIEANDLFIYDRIDASATIGRADGTFGFSYIKFENEFLAFNKNVVQENLRIQSTPGLAMTKDTESLGIVHFSAIPWVSFTALSHARHFEYRESIPKISTGKIIRDKDKIYLPISLHAHHALLDGFHAGQFFQKLEDLFSRPQDFD